MTYINITEFATFSITCYKCKKKSKQGMKYAIKVETTVMDINSIVWRHFCSKKCKQIFSLME